MSLPAIRLREAAELVATADSSFAALVVEPAEVALTLPEEQWTREAPRFPEARSGGPYRAITLDAELPLDLVGYLAPAAVRLADAGIGIVPQCGYRTDHLLVHEDDLSDAIRVLEAFVTECGIPQAG